jgi:putative oxidoreductase
MKYIVLTCRIMLGIAFTFFGANHILNFLHPPLPPGDAGAWSTLMVAHHYMTFVGVVELVGGILLLVGRFVPLGLTLLAPVLVNIILYHLLFDPKDIAVGVACAIFEAVLLVAYHRNFLPLFEADPATKLETP